MMRLCPFCDGEPPLEGYEPQPVVGDFLVCDCGCTSVIEADRLRVLTTDELIQVAPFLEPLDIYRTGAARHGVKLKR